MIRTIKPVASLLAGALALLVLPSCSTQGPDSPAVASRASASKLKASSRAALEQLYTTNPKTRALGAKASGILVFPDVTKAGFVIGGQVGQGTLFRPGGSVSYYQTTAATYGLQIGAQKFGYALFFMDQNALQNLYRSGGWEVGGSPTLVVVDEGISDSLSTTTVKEGTYAFFFNQRGLMAGLTLQGSKITRIEPRP